MKNINVGYGDPETWGGRIPYDEDESYPDKQMIEAKLTLSSEEFIEDLMINGEIEIPPEFNQVIDSMIKDQSYDVNLLAKAFESMIEDFLIKRSDRIIIK